MASTVSSNKRDKEYDEIIDPPAVRAEKIDRLVDLIRKHKGNITFYTGAGISTSAGIPDFRSGIGSVTGMPAGKWCHDATKKDWSENERKQDTTRRAKTTSTLQAIPTPSHMALVAMAKAGMLRGLISQNCDGLHRRSGFPPELLAELHGNTNLEYCGWCGKEYMRDFRASNGRHVAGRRLLAEVWPEHKKNKKLINPRRGRHYTGRRCMVVGCKGYLFDSVIDFGDNLPEKHIERGYEMAENCELCIVLGSRCSVSPACDMPISVGEAIGKKLVVVNLQRTAADEFANLRIGAKIDDVMVPVMEKLGVTIPPFVLSRCVRVKNHGKTLTVGGFDADGTPNDLIWNVQARMLVQPNAKPALASDTTTKNTNAALHPITVKINGDGGTGRKNALKTGDGGIVRTWPWLNQQYPGRAFVSFLTGVGKGQSFAIPPDLLTVQDKLYITEEPLVIGKATHSEPIPAVGARIERLWSDQVWYPAVVAAHQIQMGNKPLLVNKLRLVYPATNESEDVQVEEFTHGVEWRYPAGAKVAGAKTKGTRCMIVANAGQCRGSQLLHCIAVPQPDASGKIQCGPKALLVGEAQSVHLDTLRIMFRSHYCEPPVTLPTPALGQEQFYRLSYSPTLCTWKINTLDTFEAPTGSPASASASTTN